MSQFPKELRYSDTHEWTRRDEDNLITVGITDFAQSQLGDVVFVDLPELNTDIQAGEEVAVVESVKTAADIYSPIAGEIVEINEALTGEPALVNHDPYGDGWLFKIKINDLDELNLLLDAEHYEIKVTEE